MLKSKGSRGARRLVALVPMKPLADGKSRLSPCLEAEDRRALSLMMLRRVLLSARGAAGVGNAWLVGGDAVTARLGARLGVRRLPEPGEGLNGSLRLAFDEAFASGADAVLFLPGDLPLLTAVAVWEVVQESADLRRPVLSPDRQDRGTNALLLPRLSIRRPLLGPGSFHAHLQALRATLRPPVVHRSPALGFDVDRPADWRRLCAERPDLVERLGEWRRTARELEATPGQPAGAPPAGARAPASAHADRVSQPGEHTP